MLDPEDKTRSMISRLNIIPQYQQIRALEGLEQNTAVIHFRKSLAAEWRVIWRALEIC